MFHTFFISINLLNIKKNCCESHINLGLIIHKSINRLISLVFQHCSISKILNLNNISIFLLFADKNIDKSVLNYFV